MGLSLRGQTSGAIDINAPNAAGNNTITLPGSNGAANQFYKNSGTAGTLTHSSMIELSNGRIGIGTDDPGSPLEVNGGSSLDVATFNSHNADGPLINVQRSGTAIGFVGSGKNLHGTTGSVDALALRSQAEFTIATGGATERLRITSAGDMGLGTISPTSDGGTTFEIYDATTPTLRLNDGGEYKALFQLRGNDLEIRGSNGAMEFYTGSADGASSTKRLNITSAGIAQFTATGRVATFTGNGIEINNSLGSNVFIGTQSGTEGKIGTTNNANMSLFTNGDYSKRVELQTSGSFAILDGDLIVANGHGINFGSTTPDGTSPESELLDDYEEGYWTPTVISGGNPSSTLTPNRCRYIKVGRKVTLFAEMGFVGGDGGAFQIGGLPFSAVTTGTGSGQSSAGVSGVGSLMHNNLNATGIYNIVPYLWDDRTYFYWTPATDGAGWNQVTGSQFGGNTGGGSWLWQIEYIAV